MGISTSISLGNGMTPALQSMTRALNITIAAFQSMQNVSSQAIDTTSLNAARQAMAEAEVHINGCTNGLAEAGRQQTEFNQEIDRGASSANGLMGKIKGIVLAYATIRSVSSALSLSDELTATTARLNMMNDGLQTTEELQKMIYASAERSRGSYQATANAVSKLGLMAGEAFGSTAEIVGFSEQLNKQFTIAGTTTAGIDAAMLQLTQAMGSGVLRGEEYNSILDQAPNIIQSIADYMDVPKGQLKDMAAQGKITAEIVKNAMFAAADETNAKFQSMPMTFAQIWQSFKNTALKSFQPVLQRLNAFANSEGFQSFVNNAIGAMSTLAGVVLDIFNLVASVGAVIYNNWSIISPVVYGVAAVLLYYAFALGVVNGLEIISKGVKVASTIAAYAKAFATGAETNANLAATAAQQGLNAAILACPITWIILIIIALIAIFYAVIAVINKVKGTTISATGVIFGVFAWLAAAIFNMVVGVINASIQFLWTRFVEPFISIIEFILNVANGGFDSFGGAVANLIGQIISWFLSLGKIVTKIIDAIFGTNWTAGLSSLQNNVLSWGKNENAITLSREAPSIKSRMDMTDAYDAGYNFGQGIDNKVKGLFGGDGYTIPEYPVQDGTGLGYEMPGGTGLEDNVAQIADNTGGISDSLNISKEDLKYMRDVAEREAINRYTTAQISVDFKNTATINSDMDIDGVMNKFTEKLREAVDTSAEGVHVLV